MKECRDGYDWKSVRNKIEHLGRYGMGKRAASAHIIEVCSGKNPLTLRYI